MSTYPPGAALEVFHDGAWRPATVVRARFQTVPGGWSPRDVARTVFLDLDGDGVWDVVLAGDSDHLRVPAGPRHLRSVG